MRVTLSIYMDADRPAQTRHDRRKILNRTQMRLVFDNVPKTCHTQHGFMIETTSISMHPTVMLEGRDNVSRWVYKVINSSINTTNWHWMSPQIMQILNSLKKNNHFALNEALNFTWPFYVSPNIIMILDIRFLTIIFILHF